MVANDVSAKDSGFEADTNRAVLIAPGGAAEELPRMTKIELAEAIWDRVAVALREAP
jgi:phosphopantothenoylcysteine decarboxylase/phosphopantothenate--cysteine ligase